MKIKRGYKFRLYPTQDQLHSLKQQGGNTRFLWNYFLKLNTDKYEKEKKFIWFHDLANSLPELKKQKAFEFLNRSFSQSLQQVAKHFDKALKDFLDPEQNKEFPAFHKKSHNSDSFTVPQKFRINKHHVFIPKVGEVKWIKHRPIKGKVKFITVSQYGEQWYCSVNVELKITTPAIPFQEGQKKNIAGNDFGIKTHGTLSDGESITNPRYLEKHEKKLKRIQRWHSRKLKGSKNRRKHRVKLQRAHRKVRNCRLDYHHQNTARMITKYDGLVVESLNIQGIMKSHTLAKAVQDCAWYEFKRQLEYKCKWKGKYFCEIDRWEATSKKCCVCGWRNVNLTLKNRIFECAECDLLIDRDLNAAVNICKIGLIKLDNSKLPWDTREAFNLFLKEVEQTPVFHFKDGIGSKYNLGLETGGYRSSGKPDGQCQSLKQEKELLGIDRHSCLLN